MKVELIKHKVPVPVSAFDVVRKMLLAFTVFVVSAGATTGMVYNEYESIPVFAGATVAFASLGFGVMFLAVFMNRLAEHWRREALYRASKFAFDDEERKALAESARPLISAMINAANKGRIKTVEEYEKLKETSEIGIHYILDDCKQSGGITRISGFCSIVVNHFIVLIRHFEDLLVDDLKEAFANVALILSAPGVKYHQFLVESSKIE